MVLDFYSEIFEFFTKGKKFDQKKLRGKKITFFNLKMILTNTNKG